MTDLTSLIERIEAATGGERELDILIGAAIDLRADECFISFRHSFEICGMEQMLQSAESHQNIWREALPRYTTSIDAALTLLPEGVELDLKLRKDGTGYACAWTYHGNRSSNGQTLTLAALAAILRARQAADTEGAK